MMLSLEKTHLSNAQREVIHPEESQPMLILNAGTDNAWDSIPEISDLSRVFGFYRNSTSTGAASCAS
jgi:hypothetical protein